MASTQQFLHRLQRHERLSRIPTDDSLGMARDSSDGPSSSGPSVETVLSDVPPSEREEGGSLPDVIVQMNSDNNQGNFSPASADTGNENDNNGEANEAEDTTAEGESAGRLYLNHRRLLELQEERELRRRRQSTCTLLVIFILFRLWMEALVEGSPGLLIFCVVLTSWAIRWIRFRRDREDEIDRNIEEYVRQGRMPELRAAAGGEGSTAETDLSLMSFQAQLALAIIESQRQMMDNGGYGRPAGENADTRGVSDEARDRWVRYDFASHDPSELVKPTQRMRKKQGGIYGSISSIDTDDKKNNKNVPRASSNDSLAEEALVAHSNDKFEPIDDLKLTEEEDDVLGAKPSCSICLCEYEDGDSIAQLPCGHFYHDECISAWCTNNIRCPLCNLDLEEGILDQQPQSSSSLSDTTTVSSSSTLPLATMV